MLSPIIKQSKIDNLRQLIDGARNIVITTHLSPDGDALGSSLALCRVLAKMGKNVRVVTPDVPTATLMFLPGVKDVLAYTKYGELVEMLFGAANLIICLDFNDAHRVDRMEHLLLKSRAAKVMIDHHKNPSDFTVLTISHPEISSTCMLLYRVLFQLGLSNMIDKTVAECIYTGMMTDTGNFSYNSQDPDLYIVISDLLRRGINKDELYRLAFNVKKESQLRLNGYAIDQKLTVYPEHHAASIVLTMEELAKYSYENGDTEGLVNVPLAIPGVEYVAFIREGKEYMKISMRSVGDVPVNKFCSDYFNGGGHINAAGGEYYGTLAEAVSKFEEALPTFDEYISKK
ncbi:MAG: bifunctional oligoribonuclease/PAP phosphatase NrnA [Muribaculaceae bacterium]